MKVAILHLSDLHISTDNAQWIIDRAHQVANAVKLNCAGSQKIYVVVSGDIANKALPEEYEQAITFFTRLKSGLSNNYSGQILVESRILCVPGNHDVWLKEENDVRKILLQHVSDNYPTLSDSIFSNIVATQSNYVEFVKKINEDESYKPALLTIVDDTVGDYLIRFNLYNTAWMCGIKDQPGTIFMPTGAVKKPRKETI